MNFRSLPSFVRGSLPFVAFLLLVGCDTYEYSNLGPSTYSGYDPGYSVVDYAQHLNTTYDNAWNNTSMSGTWSVPSDIYLDPVTRQAQVPITVTWTNKDPQAVDRLTVLCKSVDPTRPASGIGWIQIGTSDPSSGSKTEYITVSGVATQATFTIRGNSMTGAFAGNGEAHTVMVHGN